MREEEVKKKKNKKMKVDSFDLKRTPKINNK